MPAQIPTPRGGGGVKRPRSTRPTPAPKWGGGVKDTTGCNDLIVGTRSQVAYTGGVEVGTVTGVHHRKSGVVGVHYPNDNTFTKWSNTSFSAPPTKPTNSS